METGTGRCYKIRTLEKDMPIFEYKCNDCGTVFEIIVGPSEKEILCKTCGSKRVDRQLSVFAVSSGSCGHDKHGPQACLGCPSAQQGSCCMPH